MRTRRIIFGPQLNRPSEVRTADNRPTEDFLYFKYVISVTTEILDVSRRELFLI
jgi:uncharacterized membrane protein